MKRLLHLTFGMAALLTLGTACTAEDPANGLDIDQVIYDGDADSGNSGPTTNPLDTKLLSGYSFNNDNYQFEYSINGQPASAVKESYYNYWNTTRFDFGYDTPDNVTSVSWAETVYNPGIEHVESSVTAVSLDNLQFEDGLLKSLIYSAQRTDNMESYYDKNGHYVSATTQTTTLPGYTVTFEYNGRNLVKINVGGTEYVQKWVDGDLVEINSPYFGTSTIEYSDVENRFGQWDPTLPFMGFFQSFGWFGDAPLHFPNTITTSALNTGSSRQTIACALDYYITYSGLIERVRWSTSLSNYIEADLSYVSR
ncbi:MAG: hypothetical protein K2H21_01345 [Muribaculaceae bacterium]|nr:hypothetical protein [Muribaculaceae bacterium]